MVPTKIDEQTADILTKNLKKKVRKVSRTLKRSLILGGSVETRQSSRMFSTMQEQDIYHEEL